MRKLLALTALALAFAAGTWVGGWLGVVAVALAAPWLLRTLTPFALGLGAAIAWLALIAGSDDGGSLGRLLPRLGGLFGVPGWVLVAVMTAGLVTAIWLIADNQLSSVLDRAISSVSAP